MNLVKEICLYVILFTFITKIEAQIPIIQWKKVYGGSLDDEARSVINTSDGNYCIVGYAKSTNGDVLNHHVAPPGIPDGDVWLIKLDTLSNLTMNKCFGGRDGEIGNSVIQTFDKGYLIGGETDSNDGDINGGLHGGAIDFWIIKTDSMGIIQWQKCLGGTHNDEGYDAIQLSDSGYIITGYTNSNDGDITGNHGGAADLLVVKLNKLGVKEWAKTIGGGFYEEGVSCTQTSDSGILIAGNTDSNDGDVSGLHNNSEDVWVLKINLQGQIEWQKCYGGSSTDFANKIILSNDGGFYISATTYSNDFDVAGQHGTNDFWVFKADSVGTIQWQKCYGGANFESGRAISPTSDGGFVLSGIAMIDDGMVSGTHGSDDCWVVKIDSVGNFEWGKALGGTGNESANSIVQTPNGGYIVVGYTESTDGDVTFNHGGKDVWVVKLSPAHVSIPELENTLMGLKITQENDELILRFFSKHSENLQMAFFDLSGHKILEKRLSITEGINYNQVDCSGFAKGLYFVKLYGNKGWLREKVVIQ
jgi:hypothetical protein